MQLAKVRGILLAGALIIAGRRTEAIVDPNAFQMPTDETGTPCQFRDNGTVGVCQRLTECPAALEEMHSPMRLMPTGCGFEGKTPLVCCLADLPDRPTLEEERADLNVADGPSVKACASFKQFLPKAPRPIYVRVRRADFEISVVGGTKTAPDEFPHMAVLGYVLATSDTGLSWRCGGTLISAQHVLTAAHCVKRFAPIVVRLGVIDLNTLTADTATNIADIHIHPDYRASRSYNDIAVIRLRQPLPLSPAIRPACLWQPASAPPESLVATGFGLTEFGGQPSPDLLKVLLRTVPIGQCARMYANARLVPNGIQSSQMCAGDASGSKDTCEGDSGGPLQTTLDQLHHVVGVTSFGRGCATQTPGVYTRVSAFVGWIERIVWP